MTSTIPHTVYASLLCAPLITFGSDGLSLAAEAWHEPCTVRVAFRLPERARTGPIEVIGATAWLRNGIWMDVTLTAPGDVLVRRPSDLNGDGATDSLDLGILLGSWGGPTQAHDLNIDGVVDAKDLAILQGDWT